jgi:hypothetical protein
MNKPHLQIFQPCAVIPGDSRTFEILREANPFIIPKEDSIVIVLARRPRKLHDEEPDPGATTAIHLNTYAHTLNLETQITNSIEILTKWESPVTDLQVITTRADHPLLPAVKKELSKQKALLPKVAAESFEKVNLITTDISFSINFNEKRELIIRPFDAVQYRKTLVQPPALLNGSGSPFHRHSPHNTRMPQPLSPPKPPTVKS